MPPTDENHEEPDMTAATVEKKDPITETFFGSLEASQEAAKRHRYEDDLPGLAIPAAGRPDPAAELDPNEGFKKRLAAMMSAVPYHEDEDEEAPTGDLAERRRETYARAWRNSLAAANITDMADWTLDQLAANQHGGALRMYVEGIGPDAAVLNLVLGGRVGSGKTSAAVAAGNYAAERGLMVRFVQHATYLRWLRPEGAPGNMPDWQVRKRFRDVDLLILDDLAAGLDVGMAATKFVRDETTALIGDRIDSGKATLITTNVRPEDLEVMIDERLVSRLSKRGHGMQFEGKDRRGRISW